MKNGGMATMTMQHHWVKHTITKVSTLPDPDNDNEIFVIEDPTDVATAEEGAVYGCDVCGVSMEGNTDTLCKGAPTDG